MKPRAFKLLRVDSVEAACAALTEHGEEARILAGGQSLVPMMNFRVATPGLLIDINGCASLAGIERRQDHIRVGALTRHRATARSALIGECAPVVARAMPHVAHLAVRNRGSFGGSIALADPAAELPACALLLGAEMVAGSARGERRIAATDFFRSAYETALAPDELLLAIDLPACRPDEIFAFEELSRRHGDFAVAGVAARARRTDGQLRDVALVGFGIADRPVRLPGLERMAASAASRPPSIEEIALALAEDVEVTGDTHHAPATKAHLAAVLVERAIATLLSGDPMQAP